MKLYKVYSIWTVCLITSFSLKAQNLMHSDCKSPMAVCNPQFTLSSMAGAGADLDDLGSSNCFSESNSEKNSCWLLIKISKSGTLGFNLKPLVYNDDLDFILYKKSSSCSKLQALRCMSSGKNLGTYYDNSERCVGMTGLSDNADDIVEIAGCYGLADNFLASVKVSQGDEYLLYVNNYTSIHGFEFISTGTCSFEMPSLPKLEYSGVVDNNIIKYSFKNQSTNGLGSSEIKWVVYDNENIKEYFGLELNNITFLTPGSKKIIREINSIISCSKSDTSIIEIKSINVKAKSNQIVLSQIYPNPAKDKIYFEIITSSKRKLSYSISNIEGKEITQITNIEVDKYLLHNQDIQNLSSGIYYVNVYDNTNKKINASQKFVVVRQ